MKKQKYILWGIAITLVVSAVALIIIVRTSFGALQNNGAPKIEPNWTAYVLDVGQGDSIFVELADGTQILIDGGVDDAVLAELGQIMPPWDRTIDIIIATHPHADHVSGLIDVLNRYNVGTVVASNASYMSGANKAFWRAVEQEGADVFDPNNLDSLVSGDVEVDVLYPSPEIIVDNIENVNERSIVIEISDGVNSMLFMGDVGEQVEERLVELGIVGDVDVLKVGHHGSKYSSSREFLRVIDPEYAVISLGKDNEYFHPHPTALKRLEFAGAKIFRTDRDGTISIESFKDGLRVISENDSSSILDFWMY